jgi:hypothetical protein
MHTMDSVFPSAALSFQLAGSVGTTTAREARDVTHDRRIDLLAQRLAIHLSQEVWQRLFHGTGRQGIAFTQAPLGVLFIESSLSDGDRRSQDDFAATLEQLSREHGGTVDAFAWGGSLVFFTQAVQAVGTAMALQRALPERNLRMGVHHGDCLLARFRSAGGSHATLLGAEATQAAAVASATDGGSIGLSSAVHHLGANFPGATAAGWRCERNANGSMRLVPTRRNSPAA